jgi:hypothetical protein
MENQLDFWISKRTSKNFVLTEDKKNKHRITGLLQNDNNMHS